MINKACGMRRRIQQSKPVLLGLETITVCHENYHVVNTVCTACPEGAIRPAGTMLETVTLTVFAVKTNAW